MTASMQAMGFAKEAMMGTLIGSVIKISLLFILSFMHIGMWSLIISSIANILFITIHHIYYVFKPLKRY